MNENRSDIISIHAPLAGRDFEMLLVLFEFRRFQSTRPLRGATFPLLSVCQLSASFQSTRPLRGATNPDQHTLYYLKFQSTRPLRGATHHSPIYLLTIQFQSTRPLRGATAKVYSFSCSLLLKTDKKLWFPAESAVCWGGFSRFWGKFAIKTRCEPPRKSLIAWGSHAAVFGVRPSAFPPADRSGGSRSARSCSRSFSPDNKSEDCLARGP